MSIFLIYINTVSESESEVAQSCLTLCSPMDCSLNGIYLQIALQKKQANRKLPLQ